MGDRLRTVGAMALVTAVLSSCSLITASTGRQAAPLEGHPDEIVAVTSVDARATVDAGDRVQIRALDPWVLEKVVSEDAAGTAEDVVDSASGAWRSNPLVPRQRVTVTAVLRQVGSGDVHTLTREVSAGPAGRTFTAKLFPSAGTYGVGVIPTVTFSTTIPAGDREALTRRLVVTTKPTQVNGSWRWLDGSTAAFRPSEFWPARTAVTLAADIKNAGIRGTGGSKPAWGAANKTARFKVSRSLIVNVDSAKFGGTVTIDGRVTRRFDVSLGKPGYATRSGIKTLTEKYRVLRMTNVGVTTERDYDIQVPYSMRITPSGEYLHGAPWNPRIGYANTSFGCTNLRLDDAAYIFERIMNGDPVITKGTGRQMETDNGPGALWNVPYKRWASTKT